MIRKLLRFLLTLGLDFRIVEEGGGGSVEPPAAPPSVGSTVVAEPAAAPAAAPVASPAPPPRTMLDAINERFDPEKTDQLTGQPRDPLGRFAHKDANGTPVAAPIAAAPVVPGAPVVPPVVKPPVVSGSVEELTQMPEGLQPKAQERFQKLANTVKELQGAATERDEARSQVAYVRDTFQQHGIKQEQFEQAASIIGAMNRGDWPAVLQALDAQRQQISLMLGQPLPGVDALSQFPDLRQAVDNMQVSEPHALELARARSQQLAGQQQREQQQQVQQTQQQEQQAVQTATSEVDTLCKQLAASDMDYPVIEAQLLPAIGQILRGVHPNQWKTAVQTQYDLLKRMASTVRGASPSPSPILRPTGQGSPATAPKSMHEAMWGAQAPAR